MMNHCIYVFLLDLNCLEHFSRSGWKGWHSHKGYFPWGLGLFLSDTLVPEGCQLSREIDLNMCKYIYYMYKSAPPQPWPDWRPWRCWWCSCRMTTARCRRWLLRVLPASVPRVSASALQELWQKSVILLVRCAHLLIYYTVEGSIVGMPASC